MVPSPSSYGCWGDRLKSVFYLREYKCSSFHLQIQCSNPLECWVFWDMALPLLPLEIILLCITTENTSLYVVGFLAAFLSAGLSWLGGSNLSGAEALIQAVVFHFPPMIIQHLVSHGLRAPTGSARCWLLCRSSSVFMISACV